MIPAGLLGVVTGMVVLVVIFAVAPWVGVLLERYDDWVEDVTSRRRPKSKREGR